MTPKRSLLLCGDSIFMQSIANNMQSLADVELNYLQPDLQLLRDSIQNAPPDMILMDNPLAGAPASDHTLVSPAVAIPLEECISLVTENRIPLILINKRQQTITLLNGSNHPGNTLDDLMRVIDGQPKIPSANPVAPFRIEAQEDENKVEPEKE